MNFWRLFSTQTTIHGLKFINKRFNKWRYFWILIVLGSLTLCLWQSTINIQDYLRFDVRTSTTFTTAAEIPFPAITFWNSNQVRGTVVGRRFETEVLVAQSIHIDFYKVLKYFNILHNVMQVSRYSNSLTCNNYRSIDRVTTDQNKMTISMTSLTKRWKTLERLQRKVNFDKKLLILQ